MNTPAMIALRPGDKVLVALTEEPTDQQAADLARTLRRAFPGVDFVIVGGVAAVAVQT